MHWSVFRRVLPSPEFGYAAVDERAKACAEQDGFAWDLQNWSMIPGAKAQMLLSPVRRRLYLDRARADSGRR